ncbi:histidine kinase [Gracilibacillus caseinilyticus]|uniref:Histidine kinase n=1 Tax=Gracilibacillus caseinilyticus TaxID=2932256 RepID=A0ABY4EZP0_9BACI|nr:sensor histidine kinase [Gracilibacillus caseinilyticus]UOQ49866.1 histidine kinase [Gracilibacillus caseinilyticus]
MKKGLIKLNQLSLRTRLIIAVILCILLPWVSTYLVSNYFTKDVLEERAAKQSKDDLRMIESGIKNILDDMMYTSNYIQFDTNMNKLLKKQELINADSPEASQQMAVNYLHISKALVGLTDMLTPAYISILFNNDLYYTNYSRVDFNPLQFKKQDWFQKLDTLSFYDTLWIGAQQNYIQAERKSDPYLITIGRKIESSTPLDAYLIISFKEEQIKEMFENMQSDHHTKLYLTNQSGEIYSSVDKQEIGETLPYNVSEKSYQVVDYQNESHLLVSYPVSYTGWRLVSLVPYKSTIGSINTVTRTTILIQGGFLVIFLIGLIVLVREMTKPLVTLTNVTKSVEKGDLSARFDTPGNHDVAQLGHSFNHMLDTIETMIEQVRIQEETKRNAELDMLQAQINPHFLFNVLNAIRLQIKMKGDTDSAAVIYSLSALLRMTINRNNAFIPLGEELSIVQHYVDLMNFRHQHDVKLLLSVDEPTTVKEVPRFFLQPIIENAIIHGYNEKQETVEIDAFLQEDGYVEILIQDNGVGMNTATLEKLRNKISDMTLDELKRKDTQSFNGIGLQNVYQRMKLIYGDAFDMVIDSLEGDGTVIVFRIPVE